MEPALNVGIPEQKESLRRLFRIKSTEIIMMNQRGFDTGEVMMLRNNHEFNPQPINLSGLNSNLQLDHLLEFRQETGMFQSRQEFSSLYKNNTGEQILVLYLGNESGKQVAKKDLAIVLGFIQEQKYRHIILITETGLNPESNNLITNRIVGYKIEVFIDTQLAFNITKHALAPISIRHIQAKFISQWAQKEQIQPEKLPMVMNIDSIAKYYGANPFDGFQMEVMGTTTDTAGSYRITRQSPVVKK